MLIGTLNHVKVKRLKRLLGIPLYSTMGVLESIWQLCMECCDEGNIGKFTDEEIAEHIEWHGSAQKLIDALTESGWFDKCETERLVVHDWWAHCPDFIRNRVQKRKARRIKKECAQDGEREIRTYVQENRDMSKKMETCLENPGHGVSISYQQNEQQQPSAIGDGTGEDAAKEKKLKPVYSEAFETWWAIYPKHKAKGDASKAFDSAIRKIMLYRSLSRPEAIEWLNLVTEAYSRTPEGDGGQFTPYGASWLNAARYDDDVAEWSKREKQSAGVTYDPAAGANDPSFGRM